MTREIKFRCWDKEVGSMKTSSKWGVHFDGGIIPFGKDHYYKDNYVVMQYTGLKDKNGKEVFEGDIVKCQQGCSHEVVWDETIGGTVGGGMPGWYLKGLIKNGGMGYAWTREEEVIGNIHQNPELLK